MKLTVVIPVYNREKIVPRTLASIERQSTRDFAVVLVDNNSTDGTLNVLSRWRDKMTAEGLDVTVIKETKPLATAARNAGLALVTTPYTMFFDSDDEMLPCHIADFLQAIDSQPEADILGRSIISLFPDGSKRTMKFTTSNMLYNHIFHSILGTQRYVARTDLFRLVGGWDETLPAWNDYELGVRLLLANPRVVQVAGQPSVVQHIHHQSITGSDFFHRQAEHTLALDVVERHLVEAGRKREIAWIDTRRVVLAARYVIEGHRDEGHALLADTLQRGRAPRRLKLLYRQHLTMGRGTAIPARLLF